MGCSGCSSHKDGSPIGCGDKGHCSSGGCNRLNTYDWITVMELEDPEEYPYVEVGFKNGSRKAFFKLPEQHRFTTGDMVVVDTGFGYDIGRVSLMGDLVRLQMKKRSYDTDKVQFHILRKANQRDLEKLHEARGIENAALVKSRAISKALNLDMKIGDVEYQADQKKATFYYTAEGWVDFRELVRHYAKEFKTKIEMRQIGARQESARIGGIGSCGRELCCSTWLTDFQSVTTTAARYQNIAINQSKLTGQCGRLKCCLNYELDLYMDELDKFPYDIEILKSKNGQATQIKIDIFKGVMYFAYEQEKGRTLIIPLFPDQVREIYAKNKRGEYPDEIKAAIIDKEIQEEDKDMGYADVTGEIELPNEKRKKKKKKPSTNNQNPNQQQQNRNNPNQPRDNQNRQERNPDQQNPNRNNPNQPRDNQNRQDRNPNQNNPNRNNPNQPRDNQNRQDRNPNQNNPNRSNPNQPRDNQNRQDRNPNQNNPNRSNPNQPRDNQNRQDRNPNQNNPNRNNPNQPRDNQNKPPVDPNPENNNDINPTQ